MAPGSFIWARLYSSLLNIYSHFADQDREFTGITAVILILVLTLSTMFFFNRSLINEYLSQAPTFLLAILSVVTAGFSLVFGILLGSRIDPIDPIAWITEEGAGRSERQTESTDERTDDSHEPVEKVISMLGNIEDIPDGIEGVRFVHTLLPFALWAYNFSKGRFDGDDENQNTQSVIDEKLDEIRQVAEDG